MVGPIDMQVPAYHRALRDHLQRTEPELWAWFGETTRPSQTEIDQAELELLRSSYRLDGDVHAALAGIATVAAGRLGLERDVVLYQALHGSDGHGDGRNARVVPLGDRIHIVFTGDLLDLLTLAEQEAVLVHELAHAHLFEVDDRAYQVLDHMVHRLDAEPDAAAPVGETARRLRLHTEAWADAIALDTIGDERPVVSALVKVSTGLRDVDPDAYLRQARQIVETDEAASRGWTHPELHIRVACLTARTTEVADRIVSQLIDGPDDLDRIDLLGQLRLQELTARLLAGALGLDADGAAHSHAYARNYPELAIRDRLGSLEPIAADELAGHTPSVRHLAGALLVDLALVEADDTTASGLDRVAAFAGEAHRIGVGHEFDRILARAVDRPRAS